MKQSHFFLEKSPHAEAGNFLALLQYPNLLEAMSRQTIESSFGRAGYRPTGEGETGVTVGWGRKVGDAHAPTSTVILIEGKVLMIQLGSSGRYTISTLVEDVRRPSRREIAHLAGSLWFFQSSCGSGFAEWWQQQEKPEVDAIARGARDSMRTLFSTISAFEGRAK